MLLRHVVHNCKKNLASPHNSRNRLARNGTFESTSREQCAASASRREEVVHGAAGYGGWFTATMHNALCTRAGSRSDHVHTINGPQWSSLVAVPRTPLRREWGGGSRHGHCGAHLSAIAASILAQTNDSCAQRSSGPLRHATCAALEL